MLGVFFCPNRDRLELGAIDWLRRRAACDDRLAKNLYGELRRGARPVEEGGWKRVEEGGDGSPDWCVHSGEHRTEWIKRSDSVVESIEGRRVEADECFSLER